MNKTPSILVDTGFPVDQNGALTELDFPNVVTTLDPPKQIKFSGTTMNWIPSAKTSLQGIVADNVITLADKTFSGYSALLSASFASIANLSYTGTDGGCFYNCSALQSINMPSLTTLSSVTNANRGGTFYNCVSLTEVVLPLLYSIEEGGYANPTGTFCNCTALTTVNFPMLNKTTRLGGNTSCGTFYGCTALQNVTLGSDGHAVTSLDSNTFYNCTQSGLTITIYTTGGAALSGSPWRATNATIVYEEA